ncbi:MAG: ORC1-type DNA replication protein [Desulfurococcaceae archaeon]|jgi:cell division control protein 6|nr:ORC1-type DNA replication protein [Desulfurococcaceae archaeon]
MVSNEAIVSVFKKPSVFKNIETLYPEYVPLKLPHRENQLKQLAEIFRPLILSPGNVFIRVMMVGGVGVGKTATAKVFGKEIKLIAAEHGLDLRYVHINCHRDRTLYEVVSEVVRQVGAPIPIRGLSAREMLLALLNYLEKHNIFTIVTLDEFNYFIATEGNDAVYFLIRIYDEYSDVKKRISYIFISRNISALNMLDPTTESYILRHTIRFDPYTSDELFDILRYRRDLAFYEGTVDDDILRYIAEHKGVNKGGDGNARSALEALLLAGQAADYEGSQKVKIEHVRKALGLVHPDIVRISDDLSYLQLHELILLKAIIRSLKNREVHFVKIGDVEEEYRYLCQFYNVKPRSHTQIYEYVNNLKYMGIIEARVSGKGFRGRTTLISISVPLEELERKVDELISLKRGMTKNIT